MTTALEFTRLASALDGTTSAPHFDRTAFKVARIYATLAADGMSASLKFTPDEQELKCMTAPEAFQPVPNAWGEQGWTTVKLPAIAPVDLMRALETAWQHAVPKPKHKAKRG